MARRVGSGAHEHEVPERDGVIVSMGDCKHSGADIYWSEVYEAFVVVDLDDLKVSTHERLLLIQDGNWDNFHDRIVACDLEVPDGLAFVSMQEEDWEDWETLSDGTVVLWDSADDG